MSCGPRWYLTMQPTTSRRYSLGAGFRPLPLVLSACALTQLAVSAVIDYAKPAPEVSIAYRYFDLAAAYVLAAMYVAGGIFLLWPSCASSPSGAAEPRRFAGGIWRTASAAMALATGLGIAAAIQFYSWRRLDELVWTPNWLTMLFIVVCFLWLRNKRIARGKRSPVDMEAYRIAFYAGLAAISILGLIWLLSLFG